MKRNKSQRTEHSDEVEQWLPGAEHDPTDYDVPISESHAGRASVSQRKPANTKAIKPSRRLKC